jgi:hypothetical protein
MKKLFTLIFSSIVINYSVNAQALPNGGFENWTASSNYDNPNEWSTLNSLTAIFGFYTCTKSTDAHGGNNSVRLESKYSGPGLNTNINGIITTGEFQVSGTSGAAVGGADYAFRPDSVVGWYKYAPISGDTGYIELMLLNATDDDTIGHAKFFELSTVTTWTRFAKKIDYSSSDAPALLRINLNASSGTDPQPGSVVYFDDLQLIFNGVGINEQTTNVFKVYPNPATEELFIKNPGNEIAKMRVFDAMGKNVKELYIGLNTTRTNIATYAPGVYFYTLTGNNSEVLHTGKFVVTR